MKKGEQREFIDTFRPLKHFLKGVIAPEIIPNAGMYSEYKKLYAEKYGDDLDKKFKVLKSAEFKRAVKVIHKAIGDLGTKSKGGLVVKDIGHFGVLPSMNGKLRSFYGKRITYRPATLGYDYIFYFNPFIFDKGLFLFSMDKTVFQPTKDLLSNRLDMGYEFVYPYSTIKKLF